MAIQCSICLHRHKPHVQARIKTAIKKREESAAAQLLADTEWLWGESQQYIEDARAAVRTQAVTEGSGKHAKTVYREYRDLSAMSGALRVAHENRRLFGDAAGAIRQNQPSAQFVLHIGTPRASVPGAVEEPTIEAVSEPAKPEEHHRTEYGGD